MKMVTHQTVGVYLPAGLFAGSAQDLQKTLSIQIILKNFLAPVPPAQQVINSALVLNSALARHREVLNLKQQLVSIVRTAPLPSFRRAKITFGAAAVLANAGDTK